MLKNQKGISIIEVLMALLISTIVTAAVITLFSNSLNTSRQLMGTAKLDQALNNAMEIDKNVIKILKEHNIPFTDLSLEKAAEKIVDIIENYN